jgi:hypothetical protein
MHVINVQKTKMNQISYKAVKEQKKLNLSVTQVPGNGGKVTWGGMVARSEGRWR